MLSRHQICINTASGKRDFAAGFRAGRDEHQLQRLLLNWPCFKKEFGSLGNKSVNIYIYVYIYDGCHMLFYNLRHQVCNTYEDILQVFSLLYWIMCMDFKCELALALILKLHNDCVLLSESSMSKIAANCRKFGSLENQNGSICILNKPNSTNMMLRWFPQCDVSSDIAMSMHGFVKTSS